MQRQAFGRLRNDGKLHYNRVQYNDDRPSVWFKTCLPAINARAMSNEEGASIGYVGCHIAHVLEMRRGKIIVASSPPHKMHALLARTTA